MFYNKVTFKKLLPLLVSLLQVKNVYCDDFTFSVSVIPSEYGGQKVAVVVDDGTPVELQPLYNGFLWRGKANKPVSNYYYAILNGEGGVVNSEKQMQLNTELSGGENLSFQRSPPEDAAATTTLNEIFGVQYTIGDSIIQGLPRIEKKLPAYDKFSLLYQEGQVPNIRAQCSEDKYLQLVNGGQAEQDLSLQNCTMTYISPYEEFFYPDITLSLAGMGSRGFAKRPYKIEISGSNESKDIYGRGKFKLRNMVYDCTYIKNKLTIDIETSMGMASGQDGFARLYLNNTPLGLYDLFEPLKKKFIKQYFHAGETDPKLGVLYKCKTDNGVRYFMEYYPELNNLSNIFTVDMVPEEFNESTFDGEKDIIELINFINTELPNASMERIEEFLDLDLLLKTFIVEYLVDHRDGFLIGGNNFNIYRHYGTKRFHLWSYDFDATYSKFQLWPTSTPFEKYMVIPQSYLESRKNLPQTPPTINPLAEKLFAKPEVKERFDELLKKVVSELFNPNALFPRIKYFQEFLKPHMYWDSTAHIKVPTKKFASLESEEEIAYSLAQINKCYNDQGFGLNGENGFFSYIQGRSDTVLSTYGISVNVPDVNSLSKDDLVGLPIETLNSEDDDSGYSSDAFNKIELFAYSTIISIVLILIMYY